MRKGFTLLELIIVIIILGVLATLGVQQYQRAVEKSRGAEARQVLGQLRTEAAAYRMQYGSLTPAGSLAQFDEILAGIGSGTDSTKIPGDCGQVSHYFQYSIVGGVGADSIQFGATRCTGGVGSGKLPPAANAYFLNLNTNFVTGEDSWTTDFY